MIKYLTYGGVKHQSRCSIVVSIPACHAGDPGSIPGNGDLVFWTPEIWIYNDEVNLLKQEKEKKQTVSFNIYASFFHFTTFLFWDEKYRRWKITWFRPSNWQEEADDVALIHYSLAYSFIYILCCVSISIFRSAWSLSLSLSLTSKQWLLWQQQQLVEPQL